MFLLTRHILTYGLVKSYVSQAYVLFYSLLNTNSHAADETRDGSHFDSLLRIP
jgi:hypothetical protein